MQGVEWRGEVNDGEGEPIVLSDASSAGAGEVEAEHRREVEALERVKRKILDRIANSQAPRVRRMTVRRTDRIDQDDPPE